MIDSNTPDSLVLLYLAASFCSCTHASWTLQLRTKWLLIIYIIAFQRNSEDRKPEAPFQESAVTSTASLLICLGFVDIRRWRIPAVVTLAEREVSVSVNLREPKQHWCHSEGAKIVHWVQLSKSKNCALSGQPRCDLSIDDGANEALNAIKKAFLLALYTKTCKYAPARELFTSRICQDWTSCKSLCRSDLRLT